jgi:hypothetical protein
VPALVDGGGWGSPDFVEMGGFGREPESSLVAIRLDVIPRGSLLSYKAIDSEPDSSF